MTPDQKRELLEAAAKAMGYWDDPEYNHEFGALHRWNPLDNSADTASMCAKLEIDTTWTDRAVICADDSREREQEVRHNGTDAGKEAAWRLAASMVAAKIGGYADDI